MAAKLTQEIAFLTMETKDIIHHTLQIEKQHKDSNYGDIMSLLTTLCNAHITLEQLQATDIASVLHRLLRACPETSVRKTAKLLLSKWKRLHGSPCHIPLKNSLGGPITTRPDRSLELTPRIEPSDKTELDAADATTPCLPQEEDHCPAAVQHFVRSDEVQEQSSHHAGARPEDIPVKGAELAKDAAETVLPSRAGEDAIAALQSQHHAGARDSVTTVTSATPQPFNNTDSAPRDKCIQLILRALTPDGANDAEKMGTRTALARDIEMQIYASHGRNPSKYKSCVRSKVANLKNPKSAHLCQGLLTGSLAPETFAQMSVEEMAGEELRRLREGYAASGISGHQLPRGVEGTATRKLRCGRCEGTDCAVTQVSRGTLFLPAWVRRGNPGEDAMTFVTCSGCGAQWYHSGWVCL